MPEADVKIVISHEPDQFLQKWGHTGREMRLMTERDIADIEKRHSAGQAYMLRSAEQFHTTERRIHKQKVGDMMADLDLWQRKKIEVEGAIKKAMAEHNAAAVRDLRAEKAEVMQVISIYQKLALTKREVTHGGQGIREGIMGVGRNIFGTEGMGMMSMAGGGMMAGAGILAGGAALAGAAELAKSSMEVGRSYRDAFRELQAAEAGSIKDTGRLNQEMTFVTAEAKRMSHEVAKPVPEMEKAMSGIAAITHLHGKELTNLTKANVAFSEVTGFSVQRLLNMDAAAINTDKSLERLGISVPKTATAQDKMNAVLKAGLPMWDSLAMSSHDVYGNMDRLKLVWEEAQNTIAEKMSPALEKLTADLGDDESGVMRLAQAFGSLASWVIGAANSVGTLIGKMSDFAANEKSYEQQHPVRSTVAITRGILMAGAGNYSGVGDVMSEVAEEGARIENLDKLDEHRAPGWGHGGEVNIQPVASVFNPNIGKPKGGGGGKKAKDPFDDARDAVEARYKLVLQREDQMFGRGMLSYNKYWDDRIALEKKRREELIKVIEKYVKPGGKQSLLLVEAEKNLLDIYKEGDRNFADHVLKHLQSKDDATPWGPEALKKRKQMQAEFEKESEAATKESDERLTQGAMKERDRRVKEWEQNDFAYRLSLDSMQEATRTTTGMISDMWDQAFGKPKNRLEEFRNFLLEEPLKIGAEVMMSGYRKWLYGAMFPDALKQPGSQGNLITPAYEGHASGGMTRPGPRDMPAGIVHAGEGVFSQEDVSAIGGPSGFMRLLRRVRGGRLRGYEKGGPVEEETPKEIVTKGAATHTAIETGTFAAEEIGGELIGELGARVVAKHLLPVVGQGMMVLDAYQIAHAFFKDLDAGEQKELAAALRSNDSVQLASRMAENQGMLNAVLSIPPGKRTSAIKKAIAIVTGQSVPKPTPPPPVANVRSGGGYAGKLGSSAYARAPKGGLGSLSSGLDMPPQMFDLLKGARPAESALAAGSGATYGAPIGPTIEEAGFLPGTNVDTWLGRTGSRALGVLGQLPTALNAGVGFVSSMDQIAMHNQGGNPFQVGLAMAGAAANFIPGIGSIAGPIVSAIQGLSLGVDTNELRMAQARAASRKAYYRS